MSEEIAETDLNRRLKELIARKEELERKLAVLEKLRRYKQTSNVKELAYAEPELVYPNISVVDYAKLLEKWKKERFSLSHQDSLKRELEDKINRAVDVIIEYGRKYLP